MQLRTLSFTHRSFLLYFLVLITLFAKPDVLNGQPAAGMLSVEQIFGSGELNARGFSGARWLDDGTGYTLLEPSLAVTGGRDIVRYSPERGEKEVLVSASMLIPEGTESPLSIRTYSWSENGRKLMIFTNTKRVWRAHTKGDYWVLDLEDRELRQLGGNASPSSLMFAKFSPDGTRAAYVREHNIYVEDLGTGEITQLTHDGTEEMINGTFDWVYEEELFLRDGFRWSPDGTRIAFWQLDASGVGEFLMINYTDSLYSHVIPVQYPKAGTTNSSARVGIVSATGGEVLWFEPSSDLRNHYIARMDWAGGSDVIVMQHLNRRQDRLEVILGSASTGQMETILVEEDSAWVHMSASSDLHWLDGGEAFTWLSERTGWRHLYRVARSGKVLEPITDGVDEIIEINTIDLKNGWVYFYASPENPTQRYLYRARLNGKGEAERLTPENQTGQHSYDISPDGRFAFHTYSRFGVPPQSTLVRLPAHEKIRTLVDNEALIEKLARLNLGDERFFRVDIGEGVELDGWEIRPPDFNPNSQYPVLFQVYGEPWSQTVVDRWGGSTYLWHQMLAQKGYVVISIDNRGTPQPRGRAWRKIVYGSIGVLASADQAAAARVISEWPYIDSERTGIWGWSGGGSMTLNALFRYPDVYETGISVAPVPDQRYYDTIYQERYMGLPSENAEGYRNGSPITFADQLEGNLLLIHGTGDDNVHYQGAEALINKLIKHNKHFTMMAYPNRSHGIREGEGTSVHLYGLMTKYLEDNLPAKKAQVYSQ